jgi:SAM-dependent methyltransferase
MEGRFTNKLWTDAPKSMSDFQLMHTILTAARKPAEFTSDEGLLRTIHPADQRIRVLDFGCGMGRNLKWMMGNTDWDVTGYDNDKMLERAKMWLPSVTRKPIPLLVSGWEFLRAKRFDVVIATLVFQHIYKKELTGYLSDLQRMTPKLLIHGRRVNDDGSNTFETVSQFFHLKEIVRRDIEAGKPLDGRPRHPPLFRDISIKGPDHGHLSCLATPRA